MTIACRVTRCRTADNREAHSAVQPVSKPATAPRHRATAIARRLVKNLVFQGGGGRGMAYLGALAALEDLGILPVGTQTSPIAGIAGASAGAITAFLVAAGFESWELAQMVPGMD